MLKIDEKFFLVLFAIIIIQGCTKPTQNTRYHSERTPDSIMHQVAMQLKKEKNLIPCGSGGGNGEMNKVRMLYLGFDYYKEVDIDEARALLIDAGNLFLKTINEDECIRAHLINHPFQSKNIEIAIFFYKPSRKIESSKKLSIISLSDGRINYKIDDPENNFLKTILIETYEAAEKKVQEETMYKELNIKNG